MSNIYLGYVYKVHPEVYAFQFKNDKSAKTNRIVLVNLVFLSSWTHDHAIQIAGDDAFRI